MRKVVLALLGLIVVVPVEARQLKTPGDWKWRTDAPATLSAESKRPPDTWYFVAMPPGWHVTTGPGALLYPTGRRADGNFALQAEVFLFPGESQQEYGIFLGGHGVESESAAPQYLAFVARRDGQAAILRRSASGFEPVVNWRANDAVLPHPGGDATAKNLLRVEAGATDLIFSANGKEIARVPRAGLVTDGAYGFRVGKDVNLHITTLDVTLRLAPVPVKAPAQTPTRPDFSGRWTADATPAGRGGDMGSGWGPTITIAQDAARLTVEYAFFSRGDMQPPLRFAYALDGSETKNTVMMGHGMQTQVSRTAWDGQKFVITTRHAFTDAATGKPATADVTQTLTLESPTSLVVETTRAGVLGGPATTTRTVYKKN